VSRRHITSCAIIGFGQLGQALARVFARKEIKVTGFAVGAGTEGSLSYWLPPNWKWKLEYLYVDLGSLNAVSMPFIMHNADIPVITGTTTTHTHFADCVVRVGLNYQLH